MIYSDEGQGRSDRTDQCDLGMDGFDYVQSLLIEGRGLYNCSVLSATATPDSLTCNLTNPKCAPHVIPVTPGKTYRLRIGSVASLSSLNFILEVSALSDRLYSR